MAVTFTGVSGPPSRNGIKWRFRLGPQMAAELLECDRYSGDVAELELESEQATASFAVWLRAARIAANWTKGDAIRAVGAAGVAERTYNHYESGTIAKPDPAVIRRICKALGLDVRAAAVALGILTVEELQLPPPPPTPPTVIRNSLTILHMQDVSEAHKILLLKHLDAALALWSEATGVKPPLPPSGQGSKRKPSKR